MSGVDYTSPSVHKADLLKIENYALNLNSGATSSLESGLAVRCYSGSAAENFGISSVEAKFPLFTGAANTVTTVWNRDFSLITAAGADQNSIRYTGTATKNFVVRVSIFLTTATSGMILYIACPNPTTGTFVANGQLMMQHQLPAPTSGGNYINFEFAVTLATSQKIELHGKLNAGSSATITNSNTISFGSATQIVPAITIVIDELKT